MSSRPWDRCKSAILNNKIRQKMSYSLYKIVDIICWTAKIARFLNSKGFSKTKNFYFGFENVSSFLFYFVFASVRVRLWFWNIFHDSAARDNSTIRNNEKSFRKVLPTYWKFKRALFSLSCRIPYFEREEIFGT